MGRDERADMDIATQQVNERLAALPAAGTSVWLDQIKRSLLTTGEVRRLVEEESLRGVTSNPTIFNQAILGSDDYDEQLSELARSGKDTRAVYDSHERRKHVRRRLLPPGRSGGALCAPARRRPRSGSERARQRSATRRSRSALAKRAPVRHGPDDRGSSLAACDRRTTDGRFARGSGSERRAVRGRSAVGVILAVSSPGSPIAAGRRMRARAAIAVAGP
jgi:hypothetical protein